MKNLKKYGELNESAVPSGLEKDGQHDPKYDHLVGRTMVVIDNFDPKKPRIMNEYPITAVDSKGGIEGEDYPTKTYFALDKDFQKFAEGYPAYIHPGEVYAFLKPEED